MLEGDPVASGPVSVDGLLGDEAVAPLACVLVVSVHPALTHMAALKVVVGNSTVVGAAVGRERFQDLQCMVWICIVNKCSLDLESNRCRYGVQRHTTVGELFSKFT